MPTIVNKTLIDSKIFTQFATSSTPSSVADKVVSLANFTLSMGMRVLVTFSNANTVAGPLTLNVNSTGAKNVYDESGTAVSSTNPAYFLAGCAIEFVYNGTNWVYLRRVVNSYVSGANWYRKWNDGFIEQGMRYTGAGGNNIVMTLPTQMTTTSYTVMGTLRASGGAPDYGIGIQSQTTTTITFGFGTTGALGVDLIVCGN